MRSDEQAIMDMAGKNVLPVSEATAALERDLVGQLDTRGPLPPSPKLKCRRTGRLYIWEAGLASLGEDAFINCDEHGNEDPATWRGRFPKGMNVPDPAFSRARGVVGFDAPTAPAPPSTEDNMLRPPGLAAEELAPTLFDPARGLPPGQAAALGLDPVAAVPSLDDFERALLAEQQLEETLRHAAG
jgi:hypothetical protein